MVLFEGVDVEASFEVVEEVVVCKMVLMGNCFRKSMAFCDLCHDRYCKLTCIDDGMIMMPIQQNLHHSTLLIYSTG